MVNTRSETNRVLRDDRNARDEGNPNNQYYWFWDLRSEELLLVQVFKIYIYIYLEYN
jgi:hypothetical protein